jgi:hypothetical protein
MNGQSIYTYCKQGDITARPFNLADMQGPVPPKAYFRGGVNESVIEEDRYYPFVLMPSQILEHEPALVSCWPFASFDGKPFSKVDIMRVWDPPVAYDPTPFVKPATITVPPRRSSGFSTPTPGFVSTSYDSPAMTDVPRPPDGAGRRPGLTQEAHDIPIHSEDSQRPNSVAIITMGDSKITASMFDQGASAQFGLQTLKRGGPPLITAGATISLGENGRLDLGSGSVIYLATKPSRFRSSDLNSNWEEPGSGGASHTVAGGPVDSSGSHTTRRSGGAVPVGPESNQQSDGSQEESPDDGIDSADDMQSKSGSSTLSGTKTDNSVAFVSSQGKSGRKKSAATGRNSYRLLQWDTLILCCTIQAGWSMYILQNIKFVLLKDDHDL